MNINFVDLNAQYLSIKLEIDLAIQKVINSSNFIGGNEVLKFEQNFSDFIGVKNVISCANGTDSLEILLKSYDIGFGDEVIIPALSWISTSEAVSSVGATPIFVDIEEDYYCIDTSLIENKITNKTKAIIPVHLYGQMADMPKIMRLANKYNLIVIEDCAQAHGAQLDGVKAGCWGDAGSFSFYPGKNLGAYGDAGAIVTNNNEIARKARMIANHGQLNKHNHLIEGRNSRMDSLQAAILNVKLEKLNIWNNKRNINAKLYENHINNKNITLPKIRSNSYHVFHLFVVKLLDRDRMFEILNDNGIQVSIHYPQILPLLKCYIRMNYTESDFPIASNVVKQIISLPMYPELELPKIGFISSVINNFQ